MKSTGFKAQEEGSASARPAEPRSDSGKPIVSAWMITARTSTALAVAMLIGIIPSNLYLLFAARFTFAQISTYSVRHLPADDAALLAWAKSKPEFSKFQIERTGDRVVIRYEYQGKLFSFGTLDGLALERQLQSEFPALGYQLSLFRQSSGQVDFFGEIFRFAFTPFFLFAGQAGMLIIGIWNIRRLARQGRALSPLFASPWGKAAFWGAGGALCF